MGLLNPLVRGPKVLVAVLAVAVVATTVVQEAAAVPKYTLVDLGTLTPTEKTQGWAVNAAGKVAFDKSEFPAGQFYNGSTISSACSMMSARSLNGLDQIVGYSGMRKKGQTVWVASICKGQTLTQIPLPNGATGADAKDINDAGTVIGYYRSATTERAFRYSGGVVTSLDPVGGYEWSRPGGINAQGAIVGSSFTQNVGGRATIWENGVGRDLNVPTPGSSSSANDVNDKGQITGSGPNANAYVYSNGIIVDLGRLPGTTFSVGRSINNYGEVVGHSGGSNTAGTPFIYTEGKMYNLNSLVDPAPGWVLNNAEGINDRGFIVGQATNASGFQRAYLLKPTDLSRFVPEFRYDSRETYITGSAAMMTDNYRSDVAEPYTNKLIDSTGAVLAAGDPADPADTLSLSYLGGAYPSGSTAFAADYIEVPNTYEDDAQRMQAQPQYGNIVYGREWPNPNGGKILQYWLFYYYNGPRPGNIGLHEGDWEMVQVNLDATGSPYRATYAQHGGGERCDWVNVQRTLTGRPIVYVGWGSHASFFSAGTHDIDAGAVLDEADGGAPPLTPTIVDITSPPAWMSWPGHWGGSGDTPGESSPDGPRQKGVKWDNPAAWSEGVSGCTESQTPGASALRLYGPEPPAPSLDAEALNGAVRINYRFAEDWSARSLRQWELVTTVDPDDNRYTPLTRVTPISDEAGSIVQPTGLAGDRYEVRVSVMSRNGRLSRPTMVPVD